MLWRTTSAILPKTSTTKPARHAFDAIIESTRACIIAHHFNKGHIMTGGRPGMHWLRGSSAWYAWADTVLLLTGRPGGRFAHLNMVKSRNREEALPGSAKLEWQKPGPFFRVAEVEADSEFGDVMEGIAEAGDEISRQALATWLVSRGYSRTKAYRAIAAAIEQGLVVANGSLREAQ